jgi:hypothetical protein
VISVDTQKKERVGNLNNHGRKWRKQGQTPQVNSHDFPSLAKVTAIPNGTYDVHRNEGLGNGGTTQDTAEFAVESIRRWWRQFGAGHYPNAQRLFPCADRGGSNALGTGLGSTICSNFSDEAKLEIVVGHSPPGTSKWNQHRMFSFIRMHWKGKPLVRFETLVKMISATQTNQGLRIQAVLDRRFCETGMKISQDQMKTLNLQPHQQDPE